MKEVMNQLFESTDQTARKHAEAVADRIEKSYKAQQVMREPRGYEFGTSSSSYMGHLGSPLQLTSAMTSATNGVPVGHGILPPPPAVPPMSTTEAHGANTSRSLACGEVFAGLQSCQDRVS